MIWRFINAAGFSKDREIAMHLYTAIYSDTTQFSNAACTPDAFRVCGDLMELGADPVLVALEAFRKQTVSGLRLLGRALSSVRLHEAPERDAVFASMKLVQRDFEETGATVEDMEGIVEYARDIDGIEAAVLVRETRDGRIKASLRSDGSTDVSKLAVTMGGGGHPGAAGLTTDGSIDEVLSLILKALGDGSR